MHMYDIYSIILILTILVGYFLIQKIYFYSVNKCKYCCNYVTEYKEFEFEITISLSS